MALHPMPDALECSNCGASIDEPGYLPAQTTDEGIEALPAAAVCGPCGFNEIGMMGCAPELDEVEADSADVLLYVRPTSEGFEIASTKS